MRRFSLIASLSILGSLIGGCAADAETVESASDAVTSDLSAEVRKIRREVVEGLCEVESIALSVTLADDDAAAKINQALAYDWAPLFASWDCHHRWFDVEMRMTDKLNERGWLTVEVTVDSEFEGLAPPGKQYVYKNFDLRTGDLVPLTSVVDAEGADILVAACKRKLESSQYGAYGHLCDGIREQADHNFAYYAVGAWGIYVVPTHTFDPDVPGVHVDWDALRGHITHPTVAAIASGANADE